jgi:hypothetical protein
LKSALKFIHFEAQAIKLFSFTEQSRDKAVIVIPVDLQRMLVIFGDKVCELSSVMWALCARLDFHPKKFSEEFNRLIKIANANSRVAELEYYVDSASNMTFETN